MSKWLTVLLLVLGASFAVGSATAEGRTSTPVLGWKGAFQNGQGFGKIKPRTVYLGGDPTGKVSSITWRNWGHRSALGLGTGWCPGVSVAAGYFCPAALHVSTLGTCHGHRAYLKLVFDFMMGGRWVRGSKWNSCTGP